MKSAPPFPMFNLLPRWTTRDFKKSQNPHESRSAPGFLLFLCATICSVSIPARAATVNWIGAAGQSYTNKPSWSSGALPLAADTATVGNATVLTDSVLYTNAAPDSAASNTVGQLLLGNVANANGTFTMNAGYLTITNSGNTLVPGNVNPSVGGFIMNGGTLVLQRNDAATFFKDSFLPGNAANSDGSFTLNNGTVMVLCGTELGVGGKGTINVNGGTFVDNGWFGIGRGGSTGLNGYGVFNLTGGTAYLLRNPGTEGATAGLAFCQGGTNGTATIGGGTLYLNVFNFAAPAGPSHSDTETLSVSAGDIYLGGGGFAKGSGAGTKTISINLSGGTFHTVNLGPNTGGTQVLGSVGAGGTNWAWSAALPANLTNSPGAGITTFAPEAGKTIALNNAFSGPGALAMAGPGTLAINGANTYTGGTAISGGTVSGVGTVQGNVTTSPGVTIAPGTTSVPGTLLLGDTLTLNTVTNIIKLSGDPTTLGGGVNDLLAVNGNLTLQNVSTIKIAPLAPLSTTSPYTVIQYAGTPLTTADAAHLHIISDSPRYSFTIVDPATTPGSIQINVTGNAANLLWRGNVVSNPTAWDHVTANWLNTGTSASDLFFNGDAVGFNDTAVTNWVTLVGSEQPTSTTMSNNTVAFTFAGAGPLAGTLDMEGAASLTLAMSNAPALIGITNNAGALIFNLQLAGSYSVIAPISDNGAALGTLVKSGSNTLVLQGDDSSYTGTIVVTNGVLQYTNSSGLGAAASPLYATNGGTLDLNGVVSGLKNIIISGNGFNGAGALISSSGAALVNNNGVNNLTLAGDTSIGAANRWDIYQNSFNGNGFKLTEVGPGTTILVDVGETSLGDIRIAAGRLGFQGNVTLGNPSKTLTVESNATLTFFSTINAASPDNGENKVLVLKGNAAFDSGGASNNFDGPIFLMGTNIFGTRGTLHLWGNISDTNGPGSLLLGNDSVGASAGDLWLDGVNTYSGATLITNRTVFVGASSSLGTSSPILVSGPGKLDVTALATFTIGTGRTLLGNGTVAGTSIVMGSGSTLTPGLGASNTTPLTMTGSLTLQTGSTNSIVVNKTGTITNSMVTGLSSVTIGGTLVVNRVGNPLAGGDAIQLFSASGTYSGNFNNIIPSTPGSGLAWDSSTLDTDGTLRVLSTGPNPSPTNMVFSFSGNQLTLSWPSDHTGWTLQAQTNGLNVGISTNWFDVAGSSTTNRVVIPVDPSVGSTFYRMVLH